MLLTSSVVDGFPCKMAQTRARHLYSKGKIIYTAVACLIGRELIYQKARHNWIPKRHHSVSETITTGYESLTTCYEINKASMKPLYDAH